MIEIWLLVVAFYSPGGDYMGNRVYQVESRYHCHKEVLRVNNSKYPMTQNAHAQCIMTRPVSKETK